MLGPIPDIYKRWSMNRRYYCDHCVRSISVCLVAPPSKRLVPGGWLLSLIILQLLIWQVRMSIIYTTINGDRGVMRIQGWVISWAQWISLTNCSYRKTSHQMGCFSLESQDVTGMPVPGWSGQKEEVRLLPALLEVLSWMSDICCLCSHCAVREALGIFRDALWETVLTLGVYIPEPQWCLCNATG